MNLRLLPIVTYCSRTIGLWTLLIARLDSEGAERGGHRSWRVANQSSTNTRERSMKLVHRVALFSATIFTMTGTYAAQTWSAPAASGEQCR